MHELSIILEIIKTIEDELEIRKEEGRIILLTLQIGEMSSVLPEYIREYYPDAIKGTVLEMAELIIESIPAIARCKACGREVSLSESGEICPFCTGSELKLISGREFFIKEIVLDSTVNK